MTQGNKLKVKNVLKFYSSRADKRPCDAINLSR